MPCRQLPILLLLIGLLVLPAISAAQEEKTPTVCTTNEYIRIMLTFSTSGIAEEIAAFTNATNTGKALAVVAAWRDLDEVFVNNIDPNIPQCLDAILTREAMALAFSQQAVLPSLVLLSEQPNRSDEIGVSAHQMIQVLGPDQFELMDANLKAFSGLATQLQNGESLAWLPPCTEEQSEFALQLEMFEQAYADQEEALWNYVETGSIEDETYLNVFRLLVELNEQLVDGNGACSELYRRTNEMTVGFNNTFLALTVGLLAPDAATSEDEVTINGLKAYYNQRLELYLSQSLPEA